MNITVFNKFPVLKYFLISSYELLSGIIFSLPRHRLCNRIKSFYLRIFGAKIGKNVVFYPGVKINPGGKSLEIGDDVDLAWGVIITTGGGCKIGDRTLIGYRTMIFTSNHKIPLNKGKIFNSGHETGPVYIEKDVWIGAGAIILPNVKIGEGAVVAAGSIVTKEVPSFTVVAGCPAKIIKERS